MNNNKSSHTPPLIKDRSSLSIFITVTFVLFFKEWDIIEKPMPDGTTKRVRRRFVVTRVVVVLKKPSELTDDEPEGIAVEEAPLDDTPYDPEVRLNFTHISNDLFELSFSVA